MKNLIKILSLLLIMSAVTFIACNKQELVDNETNQVITKPSLRLFNPIPEYSSVFEVKEIARRLKDADSKIELKYEAYERLGIEYDTDEKTTNYTSYPNCLEFENQRGFTSLRRQNEQGIFEKLNNGEDVFFILDDPIYNTLVNEDGVMKVGNRYLKFYESGLIAIVTNGDISALNKILNAKENELTSFRNVRFTAKYKRQWKEYFDISSDYTIGDIKPKKEFVFPIVEMDNNFVVKNNSFIEFKNNSNAIYTWIYEDGTEFVGSEPNKSFVLNETVQVKISNENDSADFETVDLRMMPPPPNCEPDGIFSITQLDETTYLFQLFFGVTVSSPIPDAIFYFGDGSSVNVTSSNTLLPYSYIYEYDPATTPNNTFLYPQVVWSDCAWKDEIFISFEEEECDGSSIITDYDLSEYCDGNLNEDVKEDDKEHQFSNGEKWKMNVKIWVKDAWWLTGEVGSKTETAKKIFGVYIQQGSDQNCVDLIGDYIEDYNEYPSCIVTTQTSNQECEIGGSSGGTSNWKVERNIEAIAPSIIDCALYSTHSMRVAGEGYEYLNNNGDPYLILN